MENRATCAQLYGLLPRPSRRGLPFYPSRSVYKADDQKYIHTPEKLGKGQIVLKTINALTYVHTQIHCLHLLGGRMSKQQARPDSTMPEMVQFKLNADELAQFDSWLAQKGFSFDDRVTNHLVQSHKIGVSWDAYNDCFISSSTGKGDTNRNAGLCLLSRSTDWREAVALNLFKAEVVYANGVWRPRKDPNDRG